MDVYSVIRDTSDNYFVLQSQANSTAVPYVYADCGFDRNAETRAKRIAAALNATPA